MAKEKTVGDLEDELQGIQNDLLERYKTHTTQSVFHTEMAYLLCQENNQNPVVQDNDEKISDHRKQANVENKIAAELWGIIIEHYNISGHYMSTLSRDYALEGRAKATEEMKTAGHA